MENIDTSALLMEANAGRSTLLQCKFLKALVKTGERYTRPMSRSSDNIGSSVHSRIYLFRSNNP